MISVFMSLLYLSGALYASLIFSISVSSAQSQTNASSLRRYTSHPQLRSGEPTQETSKPGSQETGNPGN